MTEVARRLQAVRARIAAACARAGRPADAVRLIAVSKRHPVEAIVEAYRAGQRDFGENYVQELVDKAEQLAAHRDIGEDLRWRFIGHLQSNKARHLARLGCAVDGLGSASAAEALSKRAVRQGKTLEVLLQVNVDREAQKAGVLPEDAAALTDQVAALPGLSLCGLMAIPAATDDPERSRASFAALRELGATLGLTELSMGMSADLEVAVEEGATMVRVGTGIFGPRPD
ncbi:MAG: YggS family pyridoxal phosphate-dependent enzyme [Myxococcales bacterium]